MSETVKVINDVDKLFEEIEVNGQSFKSENYVPPKTETKVINITHKTDSVEQSQEITVINEPVLVTREIIDIDKLFEEIEVNGQSFKSENYVPPKTETKVIKAPKQETLSNKNDVAVTQGQNVKAVELNKVLHNFEDEIANRNIYEINTEIININDRVSDVTQQVINLDHNVQDLSDNIASLEENVNNINELIPNQATAENQLADKDFVNSSVGTNTARYISYDGEPFPSVEALEAYTGEVTQNDYAFVTGIDEKGNAFFDRYKANVDGDVVEWAKEYRLNNSSFTEEQWKSINSGMTAEILAIVMDNILVQSDWNQEDSTKTDFIKNKPSGLSDETIKELIVKYSGALGELRYFPSTDYQYGFLFCDGSIFLKEVYPEFFIFWKTHFEKKCGYDRFGNPRLPDFRGKYIKGASQDSEIFETNLSQLPNIKGKIGVGMTYAGDRPMTGSDGVFTDSYMSGNADGNSGDGRQRNGLLIFNPRKYVSTQFKENLNAEQEVKVEVDHVRSYIFIKAI